MKIHVCYLDYIYLAFVFMYRFLFDKGCADYKYYEYQLAEEEKILSHSRDSQTSQSGGISIFTIISIFHVTQNSNYIEVILFHVNLKY